MDRQPNDKSDLLIRLFEDGKRFTMDLLRENERLRLALATQKAGTDSEKLAQLESEKQRYKEELEQLRRTMTEVEAENQEFAQKYAAVEQQNNSLANLYVASYRLHSTLEFQEVVNIIKEIVINLIGSEMFGVFLKDEELNNLRLMTHEGLDGRKVLPIPIGMGVVGRAAEKGESYFSDTKEGGDEPIACIPLKIENQLLGMIVIYQLLRQKDGFSPVDFDLFSLMADHAATAIYCSQLYALSERKLNTMQNLIGLLRVEK